MVFRHAFFAVLVAAPALAAEPECGELTRANVVSCAQHQSPTLLVEQAGLRASEGRREAAKPFLPSNPVLSGSIASRTSREASAFNWYVTLEQQLEIAGQSFVRTEAAERELEAQTQQLAVARAEVAEQVWRAYFETLAAKERVTLAREVEKASLAVAATVEGMSTHGLSSPVDASVADAAAVRAMTARLDAERELKASEVRLQSLIGRSASVQGELRPLTGLSEGEVASPRPEKLALQALLDASHRRIEVLRRERIPNPTLSLIAQNDGFNERVFGVGLGLPIPLPQPVGRTNAGLISEAVALESRTQAQLAQLERTLDAELSLASSDLERSQQALALYTPQRLARARQGLTALAEQLGAGRLSVREALTMQQALVELLQGDVAARLSLCLASARLRRASGLSLEGASL